MLGLFEKPKIFDDNYNYTPESEEEVYLIHVESPDNFYVRLQDWQSVYETLCKDLEQDYSLKNKSESIYLPEKDMVCVVNVAKYGVSTKANWARARITELSDLKRVRVLLLDIGMSLLVHWTALRRIQEKYTISNALVTKCHLAGVSAVHKQWSPDSVALLKEFEDRILLLHVDKTSQRGSLAATLYDVSEDNPICINELMVKHKFAFPFGLFNLNKYNVNEHESCTKSPTIYDKKSPLKTVSKKQFKTTTSTSKLQRFENENLNAKDKGPLRLEVKILNYQSPSLFYVSLVQQQETYNELFEKMQNYYSKNDTEPKENWKVGDRCCTICLQSKTWRRASIIEIIDKNAKVLYTDFACIATVSLNSLREITKEFMTFGDGAIMCHLFGMTPALGEEWPCLTKEYLQELIDEYRRIFITKKGNFKGKSMPVELWVYHTTQGGALEPNRSEWRCLNQKVIDQGLAIPDRSEEVTAEEPESSDTLSFLNLTGSIRDWLQLDLLPTKPLNLDPELINRTLEQEEECELNTAKVTSSTGLITDWLAPEPFTSSEFIGVPTNIDNDGVVYLHDISQQDILNFIRENLDVRFTEPDPKAKFSKWTVGEACIALYFVDGRFYRGRVLEVNKDTSSCLIHYVDYGNEEMCSFENLRKSIFFYEIPIQAHKCVLHGIKPVENKWSTQTLDYIHKFIVEKEYFVKVTGNSIGGITPIDIKVDKDWITDHLVDSGLAVYTDDSKPAVIAISRNFESSEQCDVTYTESDSGPDYIVESHDDLNKSIDTTHSDQAKNIVCKDWNEIMDEEENSEFDKQFQEFVTFPKSVETEFSCNIAQINNINEIELTKVFDDDKNAIYDAMFVELQKESKNMNALNGIFVNKACVAIFPEDGKWYRSIILQYSQAEGLIKVKYVDYGNVDVISLADVREIPDKYLELPPATVTAKLNDIVVNPEIDVKDYVRELYSVFIENGPFRTKIIDCDNGVPCVELWSEDNKLIYEDLINKEVFIRSQ